MNQELVHHEIIPPESGSASQWLFSLHGIFGSGKNWLPVIRRFVELKPGWGGIAVDLREHGRSVGMIGEPTLADAAADLDRLAAHPRTRPTAVLGHSFGGKVALIWAWRRPAGLRECWVVDSTLDVKQPGGEGWKMLDIVANLPQEFDTRQQAIDGMMRRGISLPVAQWMAGNLERSPEGNGARFRWRFHLDRLEKLLRGYYQQDVWPAIENPPEGLIIHVVKAAGSDHIDEASCGRIEAAGRKTGRVHLHRLPGGHWLNVDNGIGMVELLTQWL